MVSSLNQGLFQGPVYKGAGPSGGAKRGPKFENYVF